MPIKTRIVPDLPEALWPYLSRLSFPRGLEDCWIWNGAKGGGHKTKNPTMPMKLYGQVQIQGKTTPVHRVFYTHLVGPIAEGLVLDHLCENKLCVNPTHLDPCTASENILRWFKKHGSLNKNYSTVCRNGHEKTPDNLKVTKLGRLCLICLRAHRRRHHQAKRERRQEVRALLPPRTTCIHGHPFVGNRRALKQGGTYCVPCNNEACRRYYAHKKRLAKREG